MRNQNKDQSTWDQSSSQKSASSQGKGSSQTSAGTIKGSVPGSSDQSELTTGAGRSTTSQDQSPPGETYETDQ